MALHGEVARKAAAAIAAVAVVSGCGVTHHGSIAATHLAQNLAVSHTANTPKASAQPVSASRPATDPSLAWLLSAGGQAQVTFNDDVDNLGVALETEDNSPTAANRLASETDARIVLAEADKILGTPALLPKVGRAGYERMLNDFIVVANMLQPGACYCTIAEVENAWYAAVGASNVSVS
jgi:hypothetical protein